jgi:hypothetical protein
VNRRTGVARRRVVLRTVLLAVVGLIALVFVDCFNASHSVGWSDLGRAPHLAAMATKQLGSTSSAPQNSAVSVSFVQLLVVLFAVRWRVRSRRWQACVLVEADSARAPPFGSFFTPLAR